MRFVSVDPLLNANSPGYSNGVFPNNEESKAVDGNPATFVYTHSSENAYLAFDFGKFYDLDRIEVNVYGSKLEEYTYILPGIFIELCSCTSHLVV